FRVPRVGGDSDRDRPHLCGCGFRNRGERPLRRRENPAAAHRDIPMAPRPSGLVLRIEAVKARVLHRPGRPCPRMSLPAKAPERILLTMSSSSKTSLRSKPVPVLKDVRAYWGVAYRTLK